MSFEVTRIKDLTDKEFKIISQYIEKNVGIKMPSSKRLMMQSRLTSRMKALKISNFSDYIDFVFNQDSNGDELIGMIDALTTNKTDFFREADHFRYLYNTVLPQFYAEGQKDVRLWSAACSSGEEVYTLAMVMQEYIDRNPYTISNYHIVGSDISTKVLRKAMDCVYSLDTIDMIPLEMKRKYFLKSKDSFKQIVRVKKDLRDNVSFLRLNFLDEVYSCVKGSFDVIFCRNALIYFDRENQEAVIRKLLGFLRKGGYLFLGHSETILGMDLPLKTVAPTVYCKE